MKLFVGFAVLAFLVIVGADFPANITPNVVVYNSRRTTQGSVFHQNVVSSLDFLILETPPIGTDYRVGNGSFSNFTVWSHAECYALSDESCSSCLGSARDFMNEKAALCVGARIWINTTTNSCYLRYEDFDFLPESSPTPPSRMIDVYPNIPYPSGGNAEQGSVILKNRDTVLRHLLENTPANGSADFSYGNYTDKMWGHAECYNKSCERCLQGGRDQIQKPAPLTVGGQIWRNSRSARCYLRYANFQFITGDVPASPPAPHGGSISAPVPHGSPGTNKGDSSERKTIVGVTLGAAALLALCTGIFLMYLLKRRRRQGLLLEKRYEGPVVFTLEELKSATSNFNEKNKLGKGGFGEVYKAMMKDGTQLAVKRLSVQSQQGNKEFLNEIHLVTNIQHRNLVRLKGYCVQGDEKLLVYEFLENGSLDRLLFSAENLDWAARFNIAVGVARGLAYLHEESRIVIIHRDIKAENVLLDRKLNPKISDFGISKHFDLEKGYTSTRVAGTLGYLAPEYALQGRLTAKADVYSYGVLLLEIISGRKSNDSTLPSDEQLLVPWTWSLKQSGRLHEVVDRRLESNSRLEAEYLRVIQVALVCTNEDEKLRPVMSNVVAMLLEHVEIPPGSLPLLQSLSPLPESEIN